MTEPVMDPEMPTIDEPTPEEAAPVAAAEPTPVVADEPTSVAADEPTPPVATEEPVAPEQPAKQAKPARPAKGAAAAAAAEPPAAEAAPEPSRARTKEPVAGPRSLRLRYTDEVVPALVKQFEYANPNQVPKLDKIVVNVGLGEALSNAKAIDAASGDLTMITGQKPIVMKAKRSIAQFRVRTGNPIGLKVTLRGQRMWDFLERLTLLTLPRIRDFRGIPSKSFDGRGNYTLGMREQIAFPEIDYDKVDRLRGLEVSIVTTAKSDEESKRLLELLGMPFAG